MVEIFHRIYPFERRSKRGIRLKKHPLFFDILMEAGMRAWRGPVVNDIGLEQGEFVLSKTEFEDYGLKKSQWNQISTALKALEKAGYIEKTGKRLGSQKSTIYKFLPNDFFVLARMSGNDSSNNTKKIGTASGTNKENNKKKEKGEDNPTPADSFLDEYLSQLVEFFKKATKDKIKTWTGKEKEDIVYMRKILGDKDCRKLIDSLCIEGGGPCETLEDKIIIFAKILKEMLKDNTYRSKRLSRMKTIHDNFGDIVNDFNF